MQPCPKCKATGVLIVGLGMPTRCDLCRGAKETDHYEFHTLRDGTRRIVTYDDTPPRSPTVSLTRDS